MDVYLINSIIHIVYCKMQFLHRHCKKNWINLLKPIVEYEAHFAIIPHEALYHHLIECFTDLILSFIVQFSYCIHQWTTLAQPVYLKKLVTRIYKC